MNALTLIFAALLASTGEFSLLPCNRLGSTEWLKTALSSRPAMFDYDGDGDLDLIVTASWQTPRAGTYFFENTGRKDERGLPIFKPGKRIASHYDPISFSVLANGKVRAVWRGKVNDDFCGTLFKGFRVLKGRPEKVHEGKNLRFQDWRLADYDGDGRDDLIYAVGDWSDYGDMWAGNYAADGTWTAGPLKSRIYWIRNEGDTIDAGKWAPPQMVMLSTASPLDTYGNPSNILADFDGDGDLDFLVSDFVDGFNYFENIGTRQKPKWRAGRNLLMPDGAELRAELCLPSISQVDFNCDGLIDFVSGEEDGRVALYLHTGKFQDGVPIFKAAGFFRQEAEFVALGVLSTPHVVDWDGDGDEDILAGDSAGHIAFIENLSGPRIAEPKWAEPVLLSAEGDVDAESEVDRGGIASLAPIVFQAGENGSIQGPCERKWGYTTLSVADWDGDGLLDIMVNSIRGKVFLFPNIGTPKNPKLGAPRGIEVEWKGAQPRQAWGWLRPELQANAKELMTQWRTTPYMIDLNHDGLMDLVMLDAEGRLSFFERAIDPKNLTRKILKAPRHVLLDERGQSLGTNGKGGHSGRWQFAFTDWDGDGKEDLVRYGGRNVIICRQIGFEDGKWRFEALPPVSDLMLNSHGPKPSACDFDGDGRVELLLGAEDGYFYHLRRKL